MRAQRCGVRVRLVRLRALLLALHGLCLEKAYHLCEIVELGHVNGLITVLHLELLPPLKVPLDVFACGLPAHGEGVAVSGEVVGMVGV